MLQIATAHVVHIIQLSTMQPIPLLVVLYLNYLFILNNQITIYMKTFTLTPQEFYNFKSLAKQFKITFAAIVDKANVLIKSDQIAELEALGY